MLDRRHFVWGLASGLGLATSTAPLGAQESGSRGARTTRAEPREEDLLLSLRHDHAVVRLPGQQGQIRELRALLVERPFFDKTRAYVIVDQPTTQRYLNLSEPIVRRLGADAVYAKALENTAARFERIRILNAGPVYILDQDPDLNASILVVPNFWRMIAQDHIRGPIVVAAPARDVVVFGPLAQMEAVRDVAARGDTGAEPHRVLDRPLVYQNGAWRAA